VSKVLVFLMLFSFVVAGCSAGGRVPERGVGSEPEESARLAPEALLVECMAKVGFAVDPANLPDGAPAEFVAAYDGCVAEVRGEAEPDSAFREVPQERLVEIGNVYVDAARACFVERGIGVEVVAESSGVQWKFDQDSEAIRPIIVECFQEADSAQMDLLNQEVGK